VRLRTEFAEVATVEQATVLRGGLPTGRAAHALLLAALLQWWALPQGLVESERRG